MLLGLCGAALVAPSTASYPLLETLEREPACLGLLTFISRGTSFVNQWPVGCHCPRGPHPLPPPHPPMPRGALSLVPRMLLAPLLCGLRWPLAALPPLPPPCPRTPCMLLQPPTTS